MLQLKFSIEETSDDCETLLLGKVTVGRHPTNSVVLSDASVSRYHACFSVEDDGGPKEILLRDEGSTNGCQVNGRRISGETVQVHPGDQICIGRYQVELTDMEGLALIEGDADIAEETDATIF